MSGIGTAAGVVAAALAVVVGVLAVLRIVKAELAVDAARASSGTAAGFAGAIRPRAVVRLDRALVVVLGLLALALAAVMAIALVG